LLENVEKYFLKFRVTRIIVLSAGQIKVVNTFRLSLHFSLSDICCIFGESLKEG